jgi:hypothetical protein
MAGNFNQSPYPLNSYTMPTPAEMHKSSPTGFILQGEPDMLQIIEKKLLSSDVDAILHFKDLIQLFKSNSIDSDSFLNAFLELVFIKTNMISRPNILNLIGAVWARLANLLPPESDVAPELQIALSKKKKKGMPLKQFEEIRKGTPKRDSMLKSWNDYKIKV